MRRRCAFCRRQFEAADQFVTTCPRCRPLDLLTFPDDVGITCVGCGELRHMDDTTLCEDCGGSVCAACPATCPHRAEEGEQR